MHDDRLLVEERLVRVVRERLRPAVHAVAVPFEVAAWHVPPAGDGRVGDPVQRSRIDVGGGHAVVGGGRAR